MPTRAGTGHKLEESRHLRIPQTKAMARTETKTKKTRTDIRARPNSGRACVERLRIKRLTPSATIHLKVFFIVFPEVLRAS
jgi:hypothetical protein